MCLAVTQPPEPLPVAFRPVHPSAVAAGDCPPGAPLIELSLYQLFGSPLAPTFCQVAPLSIEDCNTAPSALNSVLHQTLNSTTGRMSEVMLKQGLSTCDCSLIL